MTIPVTQTKILVPRRRRDLLPRPRLIDYLYELLDDKLIIVAAPAGYGKTSLLVDFAAQAELPFCWYSLDPLDGDFQRFISHFVASIAKSFPTFGDRSRAAIESLKSGSSSQDWLVTAIVNDIYEHVHEHFVIVLDDYHLLNESQEIDGFINRFIQEVDENCHLVISSRSLLTLPDLPLMIARRQVGGLSFEELAFQAEEIQRLILQNHKVFLPETTAQSLAADTEGWITGLLLTTETMWQGVSNQLRIARVSGVGLYEYLAQQVLNQQPPVVREFLLRTSFLEEFDLELCSAVFGEQFDCPSLFNHVLHNNLFVLTVGDEGRWIRYHHLFRDFLQARFNDEYPEEKEDLLHKLVASYADRGEWEKAYAFCQDLGSPEDTAHLIEQAGSSLIKNGQLSMLAEWIDALPPGVLPEHPNLFSLRGVAAVNRGQIEPGLEMFNRADQIFRESGSQRWLARNLVRRAVAQRHFGRYQSALADAGEAAAIAENQDGSQSIYAESLRVQGMSLHHLGQSTEAAEKLGQSLHIYQALGEHQNVAMTRMELGIIHMSAGLPEQALDSFHQALQYWRSSQNITGQANVLNNLGVLHHLSGDYSQAVQDFESAILCAQRSGSPRMEAYTLCSLGDLYADLDADVEAVDAYLDVCEAAQRVDDRFLWLYAEAGKASQLRKQGDFIKAGEALQAASSLAQSSSSAYETGLINLEQGKLCLAQGRLEESRSRLTSAVEHFTHGDSRRVEAEVARLCLAGVCFNLGEVETAYRALVQAVEAAGNLGGWHKLVVAARGFIPFLEAAKTNPEAGPAASLLLEKIHLFESEIPKIRKRIRAQTTTIPFAPPKLTIRALGKSQVKLNGKEVIVPEWTNQKRVRELFFYLAANPKPHTKESIGIIFWPESSSAQLKVQFKNAVYRLRSALGQDVVLFDGERYWFNHELDYDYDVETFSQKVEQAKASQDIVEKVRLYREATGLYEGAFLPEIDGSWASPERERLFQSFLNSSFQLAKLLLETGDFQGSIDTCQRILKQDICQEEAYRIAMQAYAGRGNRAGIVRQFERCRQVLRDEINTSPSPQTISLFNTLTA